MSDRNHVTGSLNVKFIGDLKLVDSYLAAALSDATRAPAISSSTGNVA
ncbi:hypothetical protein [Tateyamaria sp. SN3-11]